MRKYKWTVLAAMLAAAALTAPSAVFAEEVEAAEEAEVEEVEEAEGTEEEDAPEWFSINVSGFTLDGSEIDPWEYVGITNDDTVSTGVLVHADPSDDSEVTGSLLPGCGVKVVFRGDEWSEISSGEVSGFVMNDYLVCGEEAKGLAETYGVNGIEANWDDVNVFEHAAGDSWIADSVDEGALYTVVEDQGHWIAIQYSEEFVGYVSEEDVHRVLLLPVAVPNDGSLDGDAEEETEEEEEYVEEEEYAEESYDDYSYTEPTYQQPTYQQPTYQEPTYTAPATEAPATEAPATEAPATEAPSTEAPSDTYTEEEAGETYTDDGSGGYEDYEDDDVENVDGAEEYFEDFA